MDAFQNWPPTLPTNVRDELKDQAIDYALSKGLLMRSAHHQNHVHHAPFTLFPSPYPLKAYQHALELQPLWNLLVDRMSEDAAFIDSVFSKLGLVDDFQMRLYQVWKQCHQLPNQQTVRLGIHRSDYMLHWPDKTKEPAIQQVEINTISASFSSLSARCSDTHRFLSNRTSYYNHLDPQTPDIKSDGLPENQSSRSFAFGLATAHKEYNRPNTVVMMVVQPGERNTFDQRGIEYALFQEYGVKMVRRTLAQIADQGKLGDGNRLLFIGDKEVSVVYFRAGYGPGDYPTDKEWNARMLIEKSFAVKCPTVAYQLIGAKKVQQLIAKEGLMSRYISAEESKRLSSCFTGIYSLDEDEEGDKAAEMALRDPHRYVLKPQREGGGNNFYGEDVANQLKKLTRKERSAYILMERIMPPPYKNVLVRLGELIEVDVVCELGIYGIWTSNGSQVVLNSSGGHLLRTKASTTNEGGVASGFACLDSPVLY